MGVFFGLFVFSSSLWLDSRRVLSNLGRLRATSICLATSRHVSRGEANVLPFRPPVVAHRTWFLLCSISYVVIISGFSAQYLECGISPYHFVFGILSFLYCICYTRMIRAAAKRIQRLQRMPARPSGLSGLSGFAHRSALATSRQAHGKPNRGRLTKAASQP